MIGILRKFLISTSLALAFLVVSSVAAQSWLPPENPDPQEIRREADKDIQEGRLGLAAEKYLWYHNHALEYVPALSGVRLSYALNDWRELADKYPRAMLDMKLARDRAEQSIRLENGDFHEFSDFVSLNRVLEDDGRTVELFKWLDQSDRHLARRVYVAAQDTLADSGEFTLCEKYIVGGNSYESAHESFERSLEWIENRSDGSNSEDRIDFVQLFYARQSAHIVSVLVNVDRSSEAAIITEKALRSLEGSSYAYFINDALDGVPPERLK